MKTLRIICWLASFVMGLVSYAVFGAGLVGVGIFYLIVALCLFLLGFDQNYEDIP